MNKLLPHFNMADVQASNEPPRIPCMLSKALRKSGHEFKKKITHKDFKLVFFDMKFQFFVVLIDFIVKMFLCT